MVYKYGCILVGTSFLFWYHIIVIISRKLQKKYKLSKEITQNKIAVYYNEYMIFNNKT